MPASPISGRSSRHHEQRHQDEQEVEVECREQSWRGKILKDGMMILNVIIALRFMEDNTSIVS